MVVAGFFLTASVNESDPTALARILPGLAPTATLTSSIM